MWQKEYKKSGNKASSINNQVALAVVPIPALTDYATRENTSTLPSFNFLTIKCGSCGLPTSLIRHCTKTDVFKEQPSAKWVRGTAGPGRAQKQLPICEWAKKPGWVPLPAFLTFLFQCPCRRVSVRSKWPRRPMCIFASRSIWPLRTRKSRRRWRELGNQMWVNAQAVFSEGFQGKSLVALPGTGVQVSGDN